MRRRIPECAFLIVSVFLCAPVLGGPPFADPLSGVGGRTAATAEHAQEPEGAYRAALGMRDAWRRGDLNKALALSESACRAFPQSLEVRRTTAALQEIAGHLGEALRQWDEVRALHAASAPGSQPYLPYLPYVSFPQYRLKVQLKRHDEALRDLDVIARQLHESAMVTALGMAEVAPQFPGVERAVLLADIVGQRERAHALLCSTERELRRICAKPGASLPALMGYRHCLHELGRLVDQKLTMPSGVLSLPPLQIKPLLDPEDKILSVVTLSMVGSLETAELFAQGTTARSSYAGAVAEAGPTRTIRAAAALSAGISALGGDERADLALKYFRLSASVDTWLRPVAAAMAAKAAPELADDILKQAARDDAEYQPQFEALRQQLAGSRAAQPSR